MLTNLDIGKNFAGETITDLAYQFYAFCDFRDANFISIDLSEKQFIACNFGNTRFMSVNLNKTKFDACFSSVYANMYADDTNFEMATMLNTHFVIDKGEDRDYITLWDDETEELLYGVQDTENISYAIVRKLETQLNLEFENSVFFRLHLTGALFARDGYLRSWAIRQITHLEICETPVYGELFRLLITNFIGDEYIGVTVECRELLNLIKPDKQMMEFGIHRIFSQDQEEIKKGLRQISGLLISGHIKQISKQVKDRIKELIRSFGSEHENQISYLCQQALDDIAYFRNKKKNKK